MSHRNEVKPAAVLDHSRGWHSHATCAWHLMELTVHTQVVALIIEVIRQALGSLGVDCWEKADTVEGMYIYLGW